MTQYRDFEVFGGAREFVNYRGPEAIIHGPAETGKTLASLHKLNFAADNYKKANIAIVRKTLTSTYSTVLQTFIDKVLGGSDNESNWPCVKYGGEKAQWFDYKRSGARIWVAGMDKSSKLLSAEFDIVYVNQAEELSLEDWETLTTRTTGRAGHMPYSQTIGDANPAYPMFWMYHRKSLRLFYSEHRENPALFNQETGEITAQGIRTMTVLNALTGVRRDRLRDGKPAQAEGAIYDEWDESIHRIYASDPPAKYVRYVAGVDWGYRNPGCLGVFGLRGDFEMYLVAQWYARGRRDDWWLERAKEAHQEFGVEVFVCDPSEPAYIDKFKSAGLNAISGFNGVVPGINAFKKRLAERRISFVRDNLRQPDETLKEDKLPMCVEDEIPGYVWSGKAKETPVKEKDHGCDMVRYVVAHVDKVGTKQKPKAKPRRIRQ